MIRPAISAMIPAEREPTLQRIIWNSFTAANIMPLITDSEMDDFDAVILKAGFDVDDFHVVDLEDFTNGMVEQVDDALKQIDTCIDELDTAGKALYETGRTVAARLEYDRNQTDDD